MSRSSASRPISDRGARDGAAPEGAAAGTGGVTAARGDEVFLTLGSNIEPESHLRAAVRELSRRFPLLRVSRIYETEPVGARDSPRFLNAAILLGSTLPPRTLKLGHLRPLEARLGRTRGDDPNAPRTIDIDLALHGDRVLELPEADIELPDPGILRHAHLALPLADLAPEFRHPTDGRTLREIAEALAVAAHVRPRDDLAPLDAASP